MSFAIEDGTLRVNGYCFDSKAEANFENRRTQNRVKEDALYVTSHSDSTVLSERAGAVPKALLASAWGGQPQPRPRFPG